MVIITNTNRFFIITIPIIVELSIVSSTQMPFIFKNIFFLSKTKSRRFRPILCIMKQYMYITHGTVSLKYQKQKLYDFINKTA